MNHELINLSFVFFPATFMLRASFSPIPERVVIPFLETTFSDPLVPTSPAVVVIIIIIVLNLAGCC